MRDTSLEESVVQSVALTDLRDAVTDVAEVGLDQVLLEGPARDVPILGTLVRLAGTIGAVRDHLFARKVARFLLRVAEIPEDERAAFIDSLSAPGERKRLGETLVLLLDRLDNMQKPDLLELLFQSYLRGQVDFATFQRLCTALDRLSLTWLPALRSFYDPERPNPREGVPPEALQDLAAAGLAGIGFGGSGRFHPSTAGGGGFMRNELGKLFAEITARAA